MRIILTSHGGRWWWKYLLPTLNNFDPADIFCLSWAPFVWGCHLWMDPRCIFLQILFEHHNVLACQFQDQYVLHNKHISNSSTLSTIYIFSLSTILYEGASSRTNPHEVPLVRYTVERLPYHDLLWTPFCCCKFHLQQKPTNGFHGWWWSYVDY